MTNSLPSFGRLRLAGFELSADFGSPRFSSVAPEVTAELRHHAATATGLREITDFLGLPGRIRACDVVELVSVQLERGQLVCMPHRPCGIASGFAIPESEATDLSELTAAEPTAVEHVVELQLLDQDDVPIAGISYRLTLPDGSVRDGTLDAQGTARVSGLTSADPCEVCFPTLDGESWSYVHATPL